MSDTFGNKIRTLRKERGYTLKDLSDRANIELTYLSKIENDKTGSPEMETIKKLTIALDIDENTKMELFRLAKQIPPEFKDNIVKSKKSFEAFRALSDFSEEDILRIAEKLKNKKKKDENKNI